MHGGAPGSGAPKENKNALKHGFFYEGSNRRAEAVASIVTGFSKFSAKYSVMLLNLSPLPDRFGFALEKLKPSPLTRQRWVGCSL
jgi:hypothetical protein